MNMDYRNYILCGLIAFGTILTAVSKPQNQSTGNDETLQNDDYEYDDRSMPADQVKSTISSSKSTMQPYFKIKLVRRTVKPGGNITLDCPVKNLADSNVILWFKEENTITNNLNVLNNAYKVAKQNFSLIIANATESLAGSYYCEVAPQKIRMQTILRVSNETEPLTTTAMPQLKRETTTTESPSSGGALNVSHRFVFMAVVMNLLMHPKYLQSLLF